MTTIAYRYPWLAADTLASAGTTKSTGTKLFRLGIYRVGLAGDYSDCLELVRRLRADEPWDRIADLKLEVEGIMLAPQGPILIQCDMSLCPIEDRFWAVGSGADLALGAMEMGASARRAVAVACKRDEKSGPPVRYLRAPW